MHTHTYTHLQSISRQTSSSSLAAEDCCTALLFPSSTSWQWNCGKSPGRLHKLGIAVKIKYHSFIPKTLDSRKILTENSGKVLPHRVIGTLISLKECSWFSRKIMSIEKSKLQLVLYIWKPFIDHFSFPPTRVAAIIPYHAVSHALNANH